MVEPCTPSSSTIANSTFRKQTGISDVVKIYMLQSAAQLNSVTDSRADGVEYCLTHEKSALAALIYVNRTQPPPKKKKNSPSEYALHTLNKRDLSVQSNLALNLYHRFLESTSGEASRATADKYPIPRDPCRMYHANSQ